MKGDERTLRMLQAVIEAEASGKTVWVVAADPFRARQLMVQVFEMGDFQESDLSWAKQTVRNVKFIDAESPLWSWQWLSAALEGVLGEEVFIEYWTIERHFPNEKRMAEIFALYHKWDSPITEAR
jgi:hypothetical protein